MLILIEGIDGSGKGTQVGKLAAHLTQLKIPFSVHPYPTAKFPELRAHLNNEKTIEPTELFLTFANDIKQEQKEVSQELKAGKLVIFDRYITSTLAYQGETIPLYEGKKILSQFAFRKPGLVLLLDLPAKLALSRKHKQKAPDRHEKDAEFLERVRQRFLQLSREGYHAKEWRVIDASRNQEQVFKQILSALPKD